MQGRYKTQLAEKIRKRQAKVGVMGLGYIGLPLALEFAKRGFYVTGIDTDANRVRQIQEGKSYSPDVSGTELKRQIRSGRLKATDGFELLEGLDCISISVPTPLIGEETPDISCIVHAVREVCKRRKKGQLITLESSTYPGTTEEVVLPILSEGGYKVGRDFFMAFSPERLDPGNVKYHTHEIPRVIGGVTTACGELAGLLYSQIVKDVTIVSSPRTAEMMKLLENAFRNVNIAFVNELAQLCFRLGIDVWEVIEGARSKPFGFMPFYPGPGIGGHCLAGHERIVIKRGATLDVPTFEELFQTLEQEGSHQIRRSRGMTVIRPRGLEALSFDLKTRQLDFHPLDLLVSRPYEGPMVSLRTVEGRTLTVTDRHPIVVHNGALGDRKSTRLNSTH